MLHEHNNVILWAVICLGMSKSLSLRMLMSAFCIMFYLVVLHHRHRIFYILPWSHAHFCLISPGSPESGDLEHSLENPYFWWKIFWLDIMGTFLMKGWAREKNLAHHLEVLEEKTMAGTSTPTRTSGWTTHHHLLLLDYFHHVQT
jgi:hypothetical protein